MRVLVTGGAGYVGGLLVPQLLADGHEVRVVDSLVYGVHSLFQVCAEPGFDFVHGDARDERLMGELVPWADVIVPLAAVVGLSACERDPWLAESTNLEAIRLLDRLRSPRQLVVFPSTNSGYGTQAEECTEETPQQPISLYARTKVTAEQELLQTANTITLRLATVFGVSPRMRLDLLVNHFVYAAVTDGFLVIFEKHFRRNFIHVRDVVDCFRYCIENSDAMAGRPYNVGNDAANLTKEELALKVQQHVPEFYVHFAEVREDPDKRDYVVSSRRLHEAGFVPGRSLDEGIRELLKGYRMLGRPPLKNH